MVMNTSLKIIEDYTKLKNLQIKHAPFEKIELGFGKLVGAEKEESDEDFSILEFTIDKQIIDRLNRSSAPTLIEIADKEYECSILDLGETDLSIAVQNYEDKTNRKHKAKFLVDMSFIFKKQKQVLEELNNDEHKKLRALLFENCETKGGGQIKCTYENEHLNEFQKKAISYATGVKDIFLIWGPPGTGKTTIVPEIIKNYFDHCINGEKKQTILVCGWTNTSVDNIVKKLHIKGTKKVIRFGKGTTLGKKQYGNILYNFQEKKCIEKIDKKYSLKLKPFKAIKDRISYKIKEISKEITEIKSLISKLKTQRDDVLKELDGQINSKYLEINNLNESLKSIFERKILESEIQIKTHKNELSDLNCEYEDSLKHIGELTASIKKYELSIHNLEKNINKLGREIAEYVVISNFIERYRVFISQINSDIKDLNESLKLVFETKILDSEIQIKTHKSELSDLSVEYENTLKQIEKLIVSIKKHENTIDNLDQKSNKLEHEAIEYLDILDFVENYILFITQNKLKFYFYRKGLYSPLQLDEIKQNGLHKKDYDSVCLYKKDIEQKLVKLYSEKDNLLINKSSARSSKAELKIHLHKMKRENKALKMKCDDQKQEIKNESDKSDVLFKISSVLKSIQLDKILNLNETIRLIEVEKFKGRLSYLQKDITFIQTEIGDDESKFPSVFLKNTVQMQSLNSAISTFNKEFEAVEHSIVFLGIDEKIDSEYIEQSLIKLNSEKDEIFTNKIDVSVLKDDVEKKMHAAQNEYAGLKIKCNSQKQEIDKEIEKSKVFVNNILAVEDIQLEKVPNLNTNYCLIEVEKFKEHLLHLQNEIVQIRNKRHENDSKFNSKSQKKNVEIKGLENSISSFDGELKLIKMKTASVNANKESEIENIMSFILGQYDVIATTILETSKIFNKLSFDLTIMDEAGAVEVANALIPMVESKKIILLGDHKQLPPIINENKHITPFLNEHTDLRKSIFQLLSDKVKHNENCIVMLQEQYRMSKDIADFVSTLFYEGKLKTSKDIVSDLNDGLDEVIGAKPQLFWFLREYWNEKINSSYRCRLEVELIKNVVANFKKAYGDHICDDIAVITPFAGQSKLIKDEIPEIDCGTVHKYQGQENKIIIFSPAKSSQFGPAFTGKNGKTLLNVAISRAQQKFIIIGSSELKKLPNYKQLYTHIGRTGFISEELIEDYDPIYKCPICGKVMYSPRYEFCNECGDIKKLQNRKFNEKKVYKCIDGDMVRSNGEVRIDDWLSENKIEHICEQKLPIPNLLLYCDWYLPKYDVYIEFWGSIHSIDEGARRRYKENLYKKNDLKLISIENDALINLNDRLNHEIGKLKIFSS